MNIPSCYWKSWINCLSYNIVFMVMRALPFATLYIYSISIGLSYKAQHYFPLTCSIHKLQKTPKSCKEGNLHATKPTKSISPHNICAYMYMYMYVKSFIAKRVISILVNLRYLRFKAQR